MKYCIICAKPTNNLKEHLWDRHNGILKSMQLNKVSVNEVYFDFEVTPLLLQSVRLNWQNNLTLDRVLNYRQEILRAVEKFKPRDPPPSTHTYSFIWNGLDFQKNQVQISSSDNKIFNPIYCKKSDPILNVIREEFYKIYFGKKILHFNANDKNILVDISADIKNIVDLIDQIVELYEFKHSKVKKSRVLPRANLETLSNEKIVTIFKIPKGKEKFIEFLYSNHNHGRKIIPLIEIISGAKEEAFLFSIKGRNNAEFVIWENLNKSRATYIFKRKNEKIVNDILMYISSAEHAKRSYLRFHDIKDNWPEVNLGFYKIIQHEDFDDYKQALYNILLS